MHSLLQDIRESAVSSYLKGRSVVPFKKKDLISIEAEYLKKFCSIQVSLDLLFMGGWGQSLKQEQTKTMNFMKKNFL